MSDIELYNYLKSFNCCNCCCLRYLDGRKEEYLNINLALEGKRVILQEDNDNVICPACLNLLRESTISSVLDKIADCPDLQKYECSIIMTAIQLPIILNLRELSIWLALIEKFPSTDKNQPPDIAVKDVFKIILTPRICKHTNKIFDQNGIMINLFFIADNENDELIKLTKVKSKLFEGRHVNRKNKELITRNIFEKHFTAKSISLELYKTHLEVPPIKTDTEIKLNTIIITGPTVFLAGRYRKLSRSLCQTPWVLEGKRVMDDSVQELIVSGVCSYFSTKIENYVFSSSGREDVDVRCLGTGRPFVLEITDSLKATLPDKIAIEMENKINSLSKGITVSDLQMVKREDLVHIKTGEEKKRKTYRALCRVKSPITVEILNKLDLPDGFITQQLTPLRVLHRRPLLNRPRTIFSVTPKFYKNEKTKQDMLVIDVVTQAGTYIKELVHGDFGRSLPNFSSILGEEIDIVALDVMNIDLDWPPVIQRN